jgi:hypothetical protein
MALSRFAMLLVAAPLLALLPGGRAAAQDATPPNDPKAPLAERINQAIDSGVEWLRKQSTPQGNFALAVKGNRLYDPNAKGDVYVHPVGCTALALYTLLKCGVPANDPVIVKGFAWLKERAWSVSAGGATMPKVGGEYAKSIPKGTYEITVMILALEAKSNPHKREKERKREASHGLKRGEKPKLDVKLPPGDLAWMKALVEALKARRGPIAHATKSEGWRYGLWTGTGYQGGVRGDADMSATQLALLAFLAAERCGIRMDDAYWISILHWVLNQQEEVNDKLPKVRRFSPGAKTSDDAKYGNVDADQPRGWAYMRLTGDHEEKNPTGSMTACGLGSILIASSFLDARGNKEYDTTYATRTERAWWDGIAWLDSNWDVKRNPGAGSSNVYTYYYLYCVERVADLKGGLNLIGRHPWYTDGAKLMVDEQQVGGFWSRKDTHEPEDLLNTCFALLFLNRSTVAITGD